MGYQKQNFVDCQVLNSAQLNHIEDGIVDLESNSNTTLAGKADKSEVQANAKSISDETTRAKGEEQRLDTAITAETTRAKGEEQRLDTAITAETTRAKGEEQRLDTAITAETTRAEQAEQALDTRTAALESCGFVVVDGKVCMKYVKS